MSKKKKKVTRLQPSNDNDIKQHDDLEMYMTTWQ